jgi:hypothetical protein
MRRTLAVVACLVAILGIVPAAFAQAPAPKVTIVGLFDQITSAGANIYDGNFSRSSEREWYARTRFRPDFTFEVGRTKAVLGLEIDLTYGQTGVNDGGFPGNATGAACGKAGSNGCLDTNTDVGGMIEIKWIYTEFDLTGKDSLMPFIPVPTVARLGGQPYATIANYKVVYANGDFAGFSSKTTFAPNLNVNLAYVQVEDELAGVNRLTRATRAATTRGNDWAFILSPEITPFKGLDIKPLYSYFYAEGTTAGSSRRSIANQTQTGTSAADSAYAPQQESRHTIGVDARWRMGPFSLDPTVMFQFGDSTQRPTTGVTNTIRSIDSQHRAWLVDVQGGFQLGPLLLEGRAMWTTGNEAKDDLRQRVNYFEPLNLDTGYWAGWSAIQALGIDYFNGGGGTMQSMPTNIGYDRYGRRAFAFKATYNLTPELSFTGTISPTWTDQKVDTDTTIAAGGASRTAPAALTNGGDSRYIGTELDALMTWRFAPNTAFDLQGAYMFAGSALDTRETLAAPSGLGAGTSVKRDSADGWTIAARVRMSF